MKLSTIIRAIVRPWMRLHEHDDAAWIMFGPENVAGPGFGVAVNSRRGWTARATVRHIGDLEIAWWGRDTMVHHAPEAS